MMKFGILSGEPLLGHGVDAEEFCCGGFRWISSDRWNRFPCENDGFLEGSSGYHVDGSLGGFQMAEDTGWEHPLQNSL